MFAVHKIVIHTSTSSAACIYAVYFSFIVNLQLMLLTLNMLPVSSSDHCDENVLRSPCKGAVLPKSTSSAVSPLVRRSLGSLPSSLSLPTSNSPHAKRQLISPQITKWFRKSTPRKLAVTPKKTSASVREEKSSVTRVKRKLCAEPDVGDNQGVTELAVKLDVGQPSRENDPKLSPSKRQRTEPCSAVNVLSPVDSNCDKQSEQMPDKTCVIPVFHLIRVSYPPRPPMTLPPQFFIRRQ